MNYRVSEDVKTEFRRSGYAILDSVIDDSTLVALREECSYFMGYIDSWLDSKGSEVFGITHRNKRYFIANRYRLRPRVAEFLFSGLMAQISSSFLGPDVYLFHEQWVVKGAEQGMKFAWHQDSGYVKFRDPLTTHKPYLTCWCALDDMTRENGTISVLPHGEVIPRDSIADHIHEQGTNDLVGYNGTNPGVEIVVPKGSVVVFASTVLHRSGGNRTDSLRRAYLAQYSSEPIVSSNGKLWSQAVPFLCDGKVVYDKEGDLAQARRK
ncbi:MAG: phytanoyl-CoA dioxygenase family protein [Gammaproteobacteria bacterium]|nr:phytanoyl-CoA dioxygenase family protein [Gammaproteobacteria bacterium]MYD81613.1 phytanoyl-CoA dioxygenase family protein [Gammaproteobacteria bacterium]